MSLKLKAWFFLLTFPITVSVLILWEYKREYVNFFGDIKKVLTNKPL